MKKLSSRLPLECLRVFLSAATLLNFSAAGRELFITQAAVSQRIRQLEDLLGVQLFLRVGKTLSLTPQGVYLHQHTNAMFDFLEETLEPFQDNQETDIVSIAASSAVSHFWLSNQLQEFSKHRPDISIRMLTTDSMSELASTDNDIVVLYSKGLHPNWDLTPLFPEILVPAVSVEYLEHHPNLKVPLEASQIAELDLLDYRRFNPHWITLNDWFIKFGIQPPKPRLEFSSYALTLEAACQGRGVFLFSEGIPLQSELVNQLVPLSNERLVSEYQYYLGRPLTKKMGIQTRELISFLHEEAIGLRE